ncbi:MAG: hypothetical protein O3A85_08580 [Proteobacteria bacterium]|nr:hypothetical protein [Pseudomonadota bacterium]
MQIAELNNGPGTYSVDVVGESHYQKTLEKICGGKTKNGHRLKVDAFLILEDDNQYDPKAVCVYIQEHTVGHLDRETARSFRKQLEVAGLTEVAMKCSAKIVGGWDRGGDDQGHFGVKIDLPTE